MRITSCRGGGNHRICTFPEQNLRSDFIRKILHSVGRTPFVVQDDFNGGCLVVPPAVYPSYVLNPEIYDKIVIRAQNVLVDRIDGELAGLDLVSDEISQHPVTGLHPEH